MTNTTGYTRKQRKNEKNHSLLNSALVIYCFVRGKKEYIFLNDLNLVVAVCVIQKITHLSNYIKVTVDKLVKVWKLLLCVKPTDVSKWSE